MRVDNRLLRWIGHLALLCTFGAAPSIALADEVQLADGSRLVGSNIRVAEGVLKIDTAFAKDLAIPMDQVTGITTDAPVAVDLPSGERLIGPLAPSPSGGVTVQSESGGATAVDMAAVTGMWDPNGPSPEDLAAEAAKPKWDGRFEVGVDGRTGNTERVSVRGGAEARRSTPGDRLNFYVRGRYEKQNSERSANEIFGGAGYELDLTDRLFAFGKLDMEYDEFEDLDLRSTIQAGLGYFFIREERHELKGRVGLGYRHEAYSSGDTNDEAILSLGYDYWWKINERARFTHAGTYSPSLDDFADYTAIFETGIEFALSDDGAWKFRTGMRNEYDSDPQPGIDELDTSYFANLAYDW